MRRTQGPLLCELHAHTRWSDGELSVAKLVDLHGRTGFALAHRFELYNRVQLFGWVADAGFLPSPAALPRSQAPARLEDASPRAPRRGGDRRLLRSPRPVYLTRLDDELTRAAA